MAAKESCKKVENTVSQGPSKINQFSGHFGYFLCTVVNRYIHISCNMLEQGKNKI